MSEITCGISGVDAPDNELVLELRAIDEDGLGTLPVGWSRITIEKRDWNPKWVRIQATKIDMVRSALDQALKQLTAARQGTPPAPEMVEELKANIQLNVDAQFAALESLTEQFVVFSEVTYVSRLEDSEAVAEDFFKARELLGFEDSDNNDEGE